MPEVKELSEALPETPMDPITGVGVVASRNRAPTGYDVVRHNTCLSVLLCLLWSLSGNRASSLSELRMTRRGNHGQRVVRSESWDLLRPWCVGLISWLLLSQAFHIYGGHVLPLIRFINFQSHL